MKEIKLSGPVLLRLYENIGGEGALERILFDFYDRMRRDLLIGFFFDGKDVGHIALMQKSFLMRAWGAAPSYTGKSPADAHAKLPPILAGHFDRRLRLLEETLRAAGVAEGDIKTWVTFEEKFREAVQHA